MRRGFALTSSALLLARAFIQPAGKATVSGLKAVGVYSEITSAVLRTSNRSLSLNTFLLILHSSNFLFPCFLAVPLSLFVQVSLVSRKHILHMS